MSVELRSIEPDAQLVAEGVWKTYGAPEEGAKLKIGYARTKEFRSRQAKYQGEAAKATKGRPLDDSVLRSTTKRAAVGTLLLDFEGFEIDGKSLPKSNAKELAASLRALLDNELIYEFVQEEAANLTNFQAERTEAARADLKSGPAVGTAVG